MPLFGPGMKPDFAEQNRVSFARTQGLAVALGGMFLGRTAWRFDRSRTATPVNMMDALPGRLATLMVARAGVFPNSKRFAYARFIASDGILSVRYGFTKTMWRKSIPAAFNTSDIASSAASVCAAGKPETYRRSPVRIPGDAAEFGGRLDGWTTCFRFRSRTTT